MINYNIRILYMHIGSGLKGAILRMMIPTDLETSIFITNINNRIKQNSVYLLDIYNNILIDIINILKTPLKILVISISILFLNSIFQIFVDSNAQYSHILGHGINIIILITILIMFTNYERYITTYKNEINNTINYCKTDYEIDIYDTCICPEGYKKTLISDVYDIENKFVKYKCLQI